ncbi:hypothetical protein MTQ12_13635 [Brevibacterium sp. R8603A2]|uniref:hypothetical protein n=1 Tax=Brevibacterium sp. R8603A2 TaxID=2929779 RepID=UPI001FF99DB3|nr:hypothetical protein [Brevibacterium sp. R8603A2]MCK1804078.1 hypothetical protein [Brevibacterium sp. R8603A2]
MSIAYKCDCGWLVTDGGPDDVWDDTNQLIDDHVENCRMNENDGPANRQEAGTAEDPNPYQKEQIVKNDTAKSTHPDTLWHPVWCDPKHCSADNNAPRDLAHQSVPMKSGRGWEQLTGEWKAAAQLMRLDWEGDGDKRTFAVIRFNDSEDLALHESDLTQLIGFLEAVRIRLWEATA